jgi:hypothetical protein
MLFGAPKKQPIFAILATIKFELEQRFLNCIARINIVDMKLFLPDPDSILHEVPEPFYGRRGVF